MMKPSFLTAALLLICIATGCGGPRRSAAAEATQDRLSVQLNTAARAAYANRQFDQALQTYRRAMNHAFLRDDRADAVNALYNISTCLLAMRRFDEALEAATRGIAEAGDDVPTASTELHVLAAEVCFAAGRHDDANLWIDRSLGRPNLGASAAARLMGIRGLAAVGRGDLPAARDALAEMGTPPPTARPRQARLRGAIAEAEGDHALAAGHYDDAATGYRRARNWPDLADALFAAGRMHEAASNEAAASDRFLRAGRSAAMQERFDFARTSLTRAATLALRVGDAATQQEAQRWLSDLPDAGPD